MRMNRRNVLLGLGTVVAGGGAALGTGAFSSVTAERTVTVETVGDSDAYLGLHLRDDLTDGETDGLISFDLSQATNGDGLNRNATTNLHQILLVVNNGTQSVDVSIESKAPDSGTDYSNIISFMLNDEGTLTHEYDNTTEWGNGESDDSNSVNTGNNIGVGEAVVFDLEIDLLDESAPALGEQTDFDITFTIEATNPSE